MTVSTVMTVVGMAALLLLPGGRATPAEPVSGGERLHVALLADQERERLSPGDRVEYTIRVRNSGDTRAPDVEVVAFLPKSVHHVSGTEGARVEEGRISWEQPLEPGERAVLHTVGEITGTPEGAEYPVTTVCLRPEPDAVLSSCTAQTHRVHDSVPWSLVVIGSTLLLVSVIGAGGYVRHHHTRRPRPEPGTPSNHSPGSVPNIRTFPGAPQISRPGTGC